MKIQNDISCLKYQKNRWFMSRRIQKLLFAVLYIIRNPRLILSYIKNIFKDGNKNLLLKAKLTILSLHEQHRNRNYHYPYCYRVSIDKKKIHQKIKKFNFYPLFSIMLYGCENTSGLFSRSIQSLCNQYYQKWQVYINNTEEVISAESALLTGNRIIPFSENENETLRQSDFIVCFQAGDEVAPDAFFRIAEYLNRCDEQIDIIYSDEDSLKSFRRFSDPVFKPDWSPDLLLSKNYIGSLLAVRTRIVFEKNLIDYIINNDQYALLLRLAASPYEFHHLPFVLYHNRQRSLPHTEEQHLIDKTAIEKYIKDLSIEADVEDGRDLRTFRIKYRIKYTPEISIVIPFRNQPALLSKCLDSIYKKSTYSNIEIIGVNNGSTQKAINHLIEKYEKEYSNIKFIDFNVPFNFSRIINFGVKHASGEHLILLNNDIEIITPDWIESLLEHSQRPEIGAVGAKLYYADNTIQHAGVIMFPSYNKNVIPKHFHHYFPRESIGINGRLNVVQNVSAVTAACMMVKKSLFEELGGFNEEQLAIAFNDVDFCIRLMKKGYRNIFTPYCEAFHYESVSRGYEDTVEKRQRIKREGEYITKMHGEYLSFSDPFYNQHLIQ